MKKLILSLIFGIFLVSFATASCEQVLNETLVDNFMDDYTIVDGKLINGTWGGAWNNLIEFASYETGNFDLFYYEKCYEDEVKEETKQKSSGGACITEWICENGDWVKADWIHPKRVEHCITNYNEKNCAISERTWNRIIPGKHCIILNDNGIGLKPKPTIACDKSSILAEQTDEVEEEQTDIIVPEEKKGFWAWLKGLFS